MNEQSEVFQPSARHSVAALKQEIARLREEVYAVRDHNLYLLAVSAHLQESAQVEAESLQQRIAELEQLLTASSRVDQTELGQVHNGQLDDPGPVNA